jgi:uncharacterized protein (DUF2345 family)
METYNQSSFIQASPKSISFTTIDVAAMRNVKHHAATSRRHHYVTHDNDSTGGIQER